MKSKLIYLEGIRGIAALFVVFSHFFQIFFPALLESKKELSHNNYDLYLSNYPINMFYNGTFAVCLFFVLSGYVLSIKYHEYKRMEIIFESIIKRYFRLMFPVLASLLIAYTFLLLNLYNFDAIKNLTYSTMPNLYSHDIGFKEVIKLALVGVFLKGYSLYNPVLWTMKYELIGSYLIFCLLPIIIFISNKYIKLIIIFILFAIVYLFMGLYFIAFLSGLILCHLQKNRNFIFKKRNKLLLFSLLLLGIYFGSYPYTNTKGTMYEYLDIIKPYENPLVFYRVIGSILILYVLLNSKRLQNIFSSKFFENLGRLSFSIYLTHFIVLCSFTSFIFLKLYNFTHNYNLSSFLALILSLPILYVISELMYFTFDKQSIKWSSLIYIKLFKPIYRIFNKS